VALAEQRQERSIGHGCERATVIAWAHDAHPLRRGLAAAQDAENERGKRGGKRAGNCGDEKG